jgi:beta-galactosidase
LAARAFALLALAASLLLPPSVAPTASQAAVLPATDMRVRDSVSGGVRSELFNDGWKFYVAAQDAAAQAPEFDDSKWADVELPHDWQIHQFGTGASNNVSAMYATGYGWYRKTFYMAPEDAAKNVTIRFDGVYMDTNVYINGTLLTLNPADLTRTWAYGYTAFHLDVTGYLKYGNEPNVLAVRCYFRNPNSRWYSGAGIYRNVWMIKTAPLHVAPDGTYVTTNGAGGVATVDTEVVNTSASAITGITVKQAVYGADGARVADATATIDAMATGATATVRQTLTVASPKLWDIDDPNLYTLKTTVTGGGFSDEYVTSFGFRTILATADDGFFLNGRRVTLHGVAMHHDLGALGAAVSYRAVERQMELLKAMGANTVRTAHNPPTPELLEICDRIGLMVVTESFDCWSSAKNAYDYARFYDAWSALDVTSWVRRERNHPSVVMWSLGNEVGGAHTDANAIARATALHDTVRASDPGSNAYTTYSTNAPEDASGRPMQIGAEVLDLFGYNYLDINIRGVNFTKWHDKYPNLKIYGGETSSAVRSRGVYMLPDTALFSTTGNMRYQASGYDNHIQSSANGIYTKTAAAAHKTVRDYAFDMGEIVWTGFDYLGEPSPYGGTSSNTAAKNSYFGIIDTAGLPKDIYYFYQSVWTDEPVLHLLPYWAPVSAISYNDIESEGGVPVWAYSNAYSVELFLNGESLGRQRVDLATDDTLNYRWVVPYEDGVVEAKAYDESGVVVATDRIETFGPPAKVALTADRQTIAADGKDLVFVEASVQDAAGVLVADANNYVEFRVSGAGTLVATDNGNSNDFDAFRSPARRAFSGKVVAVVKSDGTGGPITVAAKSHGIEDASVTVNAARTQAVTGVTLTPIEGPAAIGAPGGKLKLSAKTSPANADYDKVAYAVTNVDGTPTGAARVDRGGVLTALRDGTVRVTATALDGGGASAYVDVRISGQGAITPAAVIEVAGADGATEVAAKSRNLPMSASVSPADATIPGVAWSVRNKDAAAAAPALATIDAAGVLRPLYDGVVTVRATALDGSGVYGEADVAISGQNPDMVPVTRIALEVLSGSRALSAAANTATVRAVAWPPGATSAISLSVGTLENFSTASANATISVAPETGVGTVTARKNGSFAVVASATNGWASAPVQATLTFSSVGFEEPESVTNPYELVLARTYTGGRTHDSDGDNNLQLVGPADDRLVNNTGNRSWVLYRNVDFGPWGSDNLIFYGVNANAGGNAAEAEVHLGSRSGPQLGTVYFNKNADAWGFEYAGQTFVPEDASALRNLRGLQDICFMFTSGSMYFYGWQFTENPKTDRDPYAVNLESGADSVAPGALGFHGFTFGDAGSTKVVVTGATQNAAARVEVRDGSADGAVLTSIDFPDTSGETLGKVFNLYGSAVKRTHHLYFTFPGDVFAMESVQFLEARAEPCSAYRVTQAEDFDSADDGYAIRNTAGEGGRIDASVHVTDPNNVSFVYNGLDFGSSGENVKLRVYGKGDGTRDVRVSTSPDSSATIRIGSPDDTGYAVWEYQIGVETGVRNVDFYFMPGTDVWIDWFEFYNAPASTL